MISFPARRPTSHRRRDQLRALGALVLAIVVLVGVAIYRSTSTAGLPGGSATSLAAARKVLRGPATVSVIGDSTGNDGNEWVALWAAELGRDRRVTLRRWLDGRYRPDSINFGSRGNQVIIWNASLPGGAAEWATGRMRDVQPQQPDLVILSFGHNNDAADISSQLEQLYGQLSEGASVVLVLQNPGRGDHEDRQAATLLAAQQWARSRKVPTIDVTAAFTDPDGQMLDDVHPNDAGSQAWSETVSEALDTRAGPR